MTPSSTERQVAKLQERLIDYRGSLQHHIENPIVQSYAEELARHYYPKRADNPLYLEPVVHAYTVDLVTAPLLHSRAWLWRYNYDDLDLLSQFYRQAHKRNGYFWIASRSLEKPKPDGVYEGCRQLGVELGDHVGRLFATYSLDGARSKVAARVIEAFGGLPHDEGLNELYGFKFNESERNRRAYAGLGRYRFLRRGREWMASGTAYAIGARDLRKEECDDLWGYRVWISKDKGVQISVSVEEIRRFKAEALALLFADDDTPISYRLKNVSDLYRRFHRRRRFANATDWRSLDEWLLKRKRKLERSEPKPGRTIFLTRDHRNEGVTLLPRRSNFFWNASKELNCPYPAIWNPYLW